MKFSEEKLEKVKEIIARYPEGKQKSALIPLLHLAQEESGLAERGSDGSCGRILQIKPIEVYEVATFYSMYNLKPVGKHLFEVCQQVLHGEWQR